MVMTLTCAMGWSLLWSAAVSAAETLEDTAIAAAVGDRLLADPGVDSLQIDVDVEQGVATLRGTVRTLMAKERARRIAGTVKGVRAVINRIDVLPPFRPDDELKARIETALATDPATESYEVEVEVERQRVTLDGWVDSWAERTLAAQVAKSITGVKRLDNEIQVNLDISRPDVELENEIAAILAWDVLVDDDQITVDVENGIATLSGYVASLAEKERATNQAWTAGVKQVDASGLEVSTWARDRRLRGEKYAKLEKGDGAVAAAVEDALRRDPRVPADAVAVMVEDGKAILSGKVGDLLAKRAAGGTARNTLGVYRVVNRIRVRPDTPADEKIEERVIAALDRHWRLEVEPIGVEVRNGIVDLEGTVDTYYEKALADNAAAGVPGVVYVDNQLAVAHKAKDFTQTRHLDEAMYGRDVDWYTAPNRTTMTAKSDWAIHEDVLDQLYWSPFINPEDITVKVDDGRVTLSGTVDSWSEREAATNNAFEGGALVVDNDIKVRHGPDYYSPGN